MWLCLLHFNLQRTHLSVAAMRSSAGSRGTAVFGRLAEGACPDLLYIMSRSDILYLWIDEQ